MNTQPPKLTDDQWRRMSWHAQQQWNLAASAYRRALAADIARLADERATVKAAPTATVAPRQAAVDSSKRRSLDVVDERARPAHGTVILHGRPLLRRDERTAQQILDDLGPDPEAPAHWLELWEVLETTCTARHCTAAVEPGTRCPNHTTARSQRAA